MGTSWLREISNSHNIGRCWTTTMSKTKAFISHCLSVRSTMVMCRSTRCLMHLSVVCVEKCRGLCIRQTSSSFYMYRSYSILLLSQCEPSVDRANNDRNERATTEEYCYVLFIETRPPYSDVSLPIAVIIAGISAFDAAGAHCMASVWPRRCITSNYNSVERPVRRLYVIFGCPVIITYVRVSALAAYTWLNASRLGRWKLIHWTGLFTSPSLYTSSDDKL